MSLYGPKQLADGMRTVSKNTIMIAEDIPETQYDYRPTPDSRSVRETLLHIASKMLFDLRIHEEERRGSLEGFDIGSFFKNLPTYEKLPLSKDEILALLGGRREVVLLGRSSTRRKAGGDCDSGKVWTRRREPL